MDRLASTELSDSGSQDEIERFKSHVCISAKGCWEWTAARTPLGYGQVYFRGTRWLAHRASWILFRGNIPEDDGTKYGTMHVLHRCDNPCCINPDHLFIGTQRENANDSVSKQRWGKRGCKGEKHGRAMLCEVDVKSIRESGKSTRELAAEFSVSQSTIAKVKKKRTWTHII